MTDSKRLAIVGGGIQGTLCALACAAAGWEVTLFERRDSLWQGASGNNEGKIHLGFTYGLDASGRTQQRLAGLGARFETELVRLVGPLPDGVVVAREVTYARHIDSELSSEATRAHLAATAALLSVQSDAGVRCMRAAELAALFSRDVTDAWIVPEMTIEPVLLGRHVVERLACEARVAVALGVHVDRIDTDGTVWERRESLGRFDRVLNCAWDGLAALDPRATGLCLRAKAGFIARGESDAPLRPVTFCYGPFGDIVPLNGGWYYVSWYPACLMGFTTDLSAGARWYEEVARSFDFDVAFERTRNVLAALAPSLRLSAHYDGVRSGAILAAGLTDIYDRASQLHERTAIGLTAHGRVASINPGKLTTAPWWAQKAAEWLNQSS